MTLPCFSTPGLRAFVLDGGWKRVFQVKADVSLRLRFTCLKFWIIICLQISHCPYFTGASSESSQTSMCCYWRHSLPVLYWRCQAHRPGSSFHCCGQTLGKWGGTELHAVSAILSYTFESFSWWLLLSVYLLKQPLRGARQPAQEDCHHGSTFRACLRYSSPSQTLTAVVCIRGSWCASNHWMTLLYYRKTKQFLQMSEQMGYKMKG